MRKIKFFVLLVVAIQCVGAHGQKNSLLWEISGNGLEHASYLYGTIHLIENKDLSVRPEIDSVFKLCPQVVFEIDMDDMDQLMSMGPSLLLPDGTTIESLCATPAAYDILKTYFHDSLNLDIASFNQYKPFVLYQQIVTGMMGDDVASFELYFVTLSMKQAKAIEGLETVQSQLALFDSIPLDVQMQWIISAVENVESTRKEMTDLVAAYKTENLKMIATLMTESSPELNAYDDLFLRNRNESWIPVIQRLISAQPSFIAVGAAHLVGKYGLIRLLKKQGFTVRPVKS